MLINKDHQKETRVRQHNIIIEQTQISIQT